MSPEELLIGIVRYACGFSSERVRCSTDIAKVLDVAKRHAVLPLIVETDVEIGAGEMTSRPEDVRWQSARDTIQTKRLLRAIQTAFAAGGVRAIVCKGVALKEWAYKGVPRAVGDVDILVDPTVYQRAQEILRQLRLTSLTGGTANDSHSTDWLTEDGQIVDLQASLLEPYFLAAPSFDELWQRRVAIPSIDMPVLHPVDHVLFLLLHGLKHQWCRLSWILDVAMAGKQLNVTDWDELHQRAQQLSVERSVHIGLLLCRAVLNPPEVNWRSAIAREDRVVQALVVHYQRRLFRDIPNSVPQKIRNSMLHIFACEKMQHVVGYVRGRIKNVLKHKNYRQPGIAGVQSGI